MLWNYGKLTQIITAIRFRLSASQMSLIWPGLDLVNTSYISRQQKGGIRYEYLFRIYPPTDAVTYRLLQAACADYAGPQDSATGNPR
jgi:hypothetical protein